MTPGVTAIVCLAVMAYVEGDVQFSNKEKLFNVATRLPIGASILGARQNYGTSKCSLFCLTYEDCIGYIISKNSLAISCQLLEYGISSPAASLSPGATVFTWRDGLQGCSPDPCLNGQPCQVNINSGFSCECTPWRFTGDHCGQRVKFLIQHKDTGLYLTETGTPDSGGHCPVVLSSTPTAQSQWYEYQKNTGDPYIFYQVAGLAHYLFYIGYAGTKTGTYSAEQFYPTQELLAADSQGRRLVRIRSYWNNKYYMGATSAGSLTSVSASSPDGIWYFIHV